MSNMSDSVNPFTVERHPLSAALDSLEPDESHALEQSVRVHGVVGRIIIGYVTGSPEHSGKVVDGWQTLCAWKDACSHDDHFGERHPIDKQVDHLWFASEQEMSGFVSSMQLARRNYDVGKRAFLIIRHFQNRDSRVPSLKTLMDFCSGSGTLIKEVKRVVLADPAIGDAFLRGELGLHDAAAVARLPAGERQEAVAGGVEGIKDKLREVRERKESKTPSSSSKLQGFATSARSVQAPRAPEPRPAPEPERATPMVSEPESSPATFARVADGDPDAALRAWWPGKTREERAKRLRGLEDIAETGFDAASPADRRAFALNRSNEIAATKRDATVKANGAPAFDKNEMWRNAEQLQRTMSRNPQVNALCEAFKQSLVYMP